MFSSGLVPRKPLNLQASLLDDPVDVRVKWSPPLSSVVVTKYMLYYKQNTPGASYTAVGILSVFLYCPSSYTAVAILSVFLYCLSSYTAVGILSVFLLRRVPL